MPVVDRVIDAELAQRVVLERAGRADHGRPPQACQLGRGGADAAAGVVNEHGLAGSERGHPVKGERRGQEVHRDGGRLRVGQAVGDVKDLRRRDHHGVGISAEARQGDDPLAGREADHRPPERVDVPRHLVADDDRCARRVRIEAEAGQDVGEVDPGGADADADLAIARRRIRPLAQLEDLGRTEPRNDDLAHGQGPRGAAQAPPAAAARSTAGSAAPAAPSGRAGGSRPGRTRPTRANPSPRR